jgi:DEAD/DEAH box helicase domain-containing protein
MARLDAFTLSKHLQTRLVDFCDSNFWLHDEVMRETLRRTWQATPDEGGLIGELLVEGAFRPANRGETLAHLVTQGLFDPWLAQHLDKPSSVPSDRALHTHQAEAVRQAAANPSHPPAMIVTAGTGAGKTEAFLLPLLNHLARTPYEAGQGCRALILYPMNALVNDQVSRLYEWLREQTRLTIFHFTSETPNSDKLANAQGVPTWDACRFRTRRQARGQDAFQGRKDRVPDIIITNYSMLEYMLCRPQDRLFFGRNLRTVVLDEAHLYHGTLAAEMTLLLRRIAVRCGLKPRDLLHLATSATIGSGDNGELRDFAATIFSRAPEEVVVIKGERQPLELPEAFPPAVAATPEAILALPELPSTIEVQQGVERLRIDLAATQALQPGLATLVEAGCAQAAIAEAKGSLGAALSLALRNAPLVQRLQQQLFDQQRAPLSTLTHSLWGRGDEVAREATVKLLRWTAAARSSLEETPLLPHRLHLTVRSADGLVICLNPRCTAPPELRTRRLGAVNSGTRTECLHCGGMTLAVVRCGSCGEWMLQGRTVDGNLIADQSRVTDDDKAKNSTKRRPVTRYTTRGLYTKGVGGQHPLVHDDGTPITDHAAVLANLNDRQARFVDLETRCEGLIHQPERHTHERVLLTTERCPRCGEEPSEIAPLGGSESLALSIVAETLLADTPSLPVPHGSNEMLPAQGRRMLAFSDSRAQAARLGPRLRRQHELQVVRAAIIRMLRSHQVNDFAVKQMQRNLDGLRTDLAATTVGAEQAYYQQEIARLERELEAIEIGLPMHSWRDKLAQAPVLTQLLDEETALQHEPAQPWPAAWARNEGEVRNDHRVLSMLASELVRPNRRAANVEALGFAEITYSTLSTWVPPASYVAGLPPSTTMSIGAMAEALESVWPQLMATLLDHLRTTGSVTLGSYKLDKEVELRGLHVGKWCSQKQLRGDGRRTAATEGTQRRFVRAVLSTLGVAEADLTTEMDRLLDAAFEQLLAHATPNGQVAASGQVPWLRHERRAEPNSEHVCEQLQVYFAELSMRLPRLSYLCPTTATVHSRTVLGHSYGVGQPASQQGDPSSTFRALEEATQEQLDAHPRLARQRKEYVDPDTQLFDMALWAEEHSAQLDAKENLRLQELFKQGKRNMLSATTTLELGIDIGGLTTALLRNVPPNKANYLQRAGRVGRRSDGSSIVVTFCRSTPYDREIFGNLGGYLARPFKRPRVLLGRDRIVMRHIQACLMGLFFGRVYHDGMQKGAMDAFGLMHSFCAMGRVRHWKGANDPKPQLESPQLFTPPEPRPSWWCLPGGAPATRGLSQHFEAFLDHVATTEGYQGYLGDLEPLTEGTQISISDQAAWSATIAGIKARFVHARDSWVDEYEGLLSYWQQLDSSAVAQANQLYYGLKLLCTQTVIEVLGERQWLPRYGFPMGLQQLQINDDNDDKGRGSGDSSSEEPRYRLERKASQALREYVPGSQLMAGGKVFTSRGLLKHWKGARADEAFGLTGWLKTCEQDHTYYIGWDPKDTTDICPICASEPKNSGQRLLFTKHGYTTARWDKPTFRYNIETVGEAKLASIALTPAVVKKGHRTPIERVNFGEVAGLRALYRADGEMLYFNRGANELGFAICTVCGYADSESSKKGKDFAELPSGFDRHAAIFSDKETSVCSFKGKHMSTPLRHYTLSAQDTTDVLQLDVLGSGDAHAVLEEQRRERWPGVMLTLSIALQQAGGRLLEMDSRELGFTTVPVTSPQVGHAPFIFDDVPGGAGHTYELLELGREWLLEARRVLEVNPEHHERCQKACVQCLLSFETQSFVDKLERRLTWQVLDAMLGPNPHDRVSL